MKESNISEQIERRVSIAPMMDYTDKHFRFFLRLISKYVILYTEMISLNAIYYNLKDKNKIHKLMDFHPAEHPIIIQIGGYDISILSHCLEIIQKYEYDGININCGCPSDKVEKGNFGVVLMNEPDHVVKMIKELKKTLLPISIKHRLGFKSNTIDKTNYEYLKKFISICYDAGCSHFIIHARFAYLEKFNPKQNRQIPPLMYEWVYRIKEEFPELKIELNGGIKSINEILHHLNFVDSVMIGRAAYENPFFLKDIDELFLNQPESLNRKDIFRKFIPYIMEELEKGQDLFSIIKHTFGLFYGIENSKKWKQYIIQECENIKKNKINNIFKEYIKDILESSLNIISDMSIEDKIQSSYAKKFT